MITWRLSSGIHVGNHVGCSLFLPYMWRDLYPYIAVDWHYVNMYFVLYYCCYYLESSLLYFSLYFSLSSVSPSSLYYFNIYFTYHFTYIYVNCKTQTMHFSLLYPHTTQSTHLKKNCNKVRKFVLINLLCCVILVWLQYIIFILSHSTSLCPLTTPKFPITRLMPWAYYNRFIAL